MVRPIDGRSPSPIAPLDAPQRNAVAPNTQQTPTLGSGDTFGGLVSDFAALGAGRKGADPSALRRIQSGLDQNGLPANALDVSELPPNVAQAAVALQAQGGTLTAYQLQDGDTQVFAAALQEDAGDLDVHLFDGSGTELASGHQAPGASGFAWSTVAPPAPPPTPAVQPHDPAMPEPTLTKVEKQTPTYQDVPGSLFDGKTPSAADVVQGELGDCFFLSSLASLAQNHPETIQQNLVDNGDGTYTATFYKAKKDGSFDPVQITIDGKLPEEPDDQGHEGEVYASSPDSKELWVSLYEKAYAEFRKGYTKLDQGGNETDAMGALTGKTASQTDVDFKNLDAVYQQLQAACAAGQLTTAGTYDKKDIAKHLREISKQGYTRFDPKTFDYEKYGMVDGHAYTVVGVYEKGGEKFVQLRNPWGNTSPQGEGAHDTDDGVFNMPLKEFGALYEEVSIGG